jgi:uncharacterized protein (DUF302 family)
MRRSLYGALLAILLQAPRPAPAEELIMIRSVSPFPEAMLALQESISSPGYTVSRVQRIDVGLTGMGYKTDMYRMVFAGKLDEIRELVDKSPELVPYLPPKVSIFAEGEQTVPVTINPRLYGDFAGTAVDPVFFDRRESDLRAIFHDVGTAR